MTTSRPLFKGNNLLIWILLGLAGLHCTRCIFFDNVSYIHLDRYAAGTEENPFQQRVAMVPVLRSANRNGVLRRIANYLEQRERTQLGRKVPGSGETVTAMKVACILIGLACVWGMTLLLGLYGRTHLGELWWLAPAISLLMLFTSFAARSEQAYWYPYDLPHMLVFGSACLCILTGRWQLMLALFVLDIPIRETSIYLIPLALSLSSWRLKPQRVAFLVIAMGVVWLAIHIPIAQHYAHRHSQAGGRMPRNLENIFSPLHVGQIASALGFLLLPVWLGRGLLRQRVRMFLYLSVPCFLVTAYYGIWIETRITLEWTMPFAMLAATECVQAMKRLRLGEIHPELAVAPALVQRVPSGRAA